MWVDEECILDTALGVYDAQGYVVERSVATTVD
jgi:hypothetical protein